MTGAELAQKIREAAANSGITVTEFMAPLGLVNGASLVNTIARAKRPKPLTVARIMQLLTGEPIPKALAKAGPRSCGQVRKSGPVPAVPVIEPTYVQRDPCFFCGTRGDLDCKHRKGARHG